MVVHDKCEICNGVRAIVWNPETNKGIGDIHIRCNEGYDLVPFHFCKRCAEVAKDWHDNPEVVFRRRSQIADRIREKMESHRIRVHERSDSAWKGQEMTIYTWNPILIPGQTVVMPGKFRERHVQCCNSRLEEELGIFVDGVIVPRREWHW